MKSLDNYSERLDKASDHYYEKYRQEKERWGVHEITVISPLDGAIGVRDLTEAQFRYLTIVSLDSNRMCVIGSSEKIPRPHVFCQLWLLASQLKAGVATETDLDNYNGPYKLELAEA